MVGTGVRLRYTEGGQRAEERRGRGVQSGCTATGGRRFGGFGAKPSPTPGKRKASATTSEGAEMDGLVGRQCPQAYRFDGLGLKTIAHLLWAGRSLDKIETLKETDGHVADIPRMRRIEATTRSYGRRWMNSSMYLSGFAPTGVESSN